MTVKSLKDILNDLSEDNDNAIVIIRQDGAELQIAKSAGMGAEYIHGSVYSDREPDTVFVISSDY